MKNIFKLLLVSFLFVGLLSGCGGSSDEGGSGDEETVEKEEKEFYAVGETAEFDGLYLTVDSVEKHMGKQYSTPEEGNEYVRVMVTYENKSDDEQSFNPFDFEMQNSQGIIKNQAFYSDGEDLSSGSLASGGKVSGVITFEQPIDDPDLTLIYTGNMFMDDSVRKFKMQ